MNIDKEIQNIILEKPSRILEKKELKEDHLSLDSDKVRFINDIRSRSIAEGLIEDFRKICDCDPRELSSKELDAKYKKVEKWANENLGNKEIKKENKMTDKKVIKEADERIKNAFNTLVAAKKALEEAQTQLSINLSYHFIKLYDSNLTKIDEEIESAKKSVTALAQDIRTKLKV